MLRRIVPLFLCLGLSAGLLHAQTGTAATYGTPVDLTIQSDLPQLITFEGKANEIIYVSQYSETVDIPLVLYGPDGAQLASSGDFQQQIIPPVTLPADGTYTVSVQRPDYDDTTGTTQILVDTTPLQEISNESVSGQFTLPGQMVWVQVQAIDQQLYRMQATCDNCSLFEILPSQDIVGITYTQANPVTVLDLWKETGKALIGSYSAVAGSYTLGVTSIYPSDLTPGIARDGTLTNGAYEVFSFTSAAGKAWRLDATLSNQGDRIMRLFQFQDQPSWNTQVQADTGSGPEGNPQITPFIAPLNATYYVVLEWRAYREDAEPSPYTITLRPETLRQLTPDGVAYSGSITGTDGTERYLYRGTAGETLTLTLARTEGEGQPALRIVGPDDEALVFSGRAVTRLVADLTLPSDGLYQFAISNISNDPASVLTYTISLQAAPTP